MPRSLKPNSPGVRRAPPLKKVHPLHPWIPGLIIATLLGFGILFFPSLFSFKLHQDETSILQKPFPVSVNPETKTITENAEVEALLTEEHPRLSTATNHINDIFGRVASAIASIPGYEMLGAVGIRFVTIYPGYRQEEVARAFGRVLGWDAKKQSEFIKEMNANPNPINEGEIVPATYILEGDIGFKEVHQLLKEKFYDSILTRYPDEIAKLIPLEEALTIASMLERETSDPAEMRIISGIIWNRIWNGMNLQIDATLQYAKSTANKGKGGEWWPKVVPKDKYIKSTYNTYLHEGLPPAPIANPSIAAVIAALNPKKTDCIFYFHDKHGNFFCSATYKEHVAVLKEKYGRGK